MDHLLKNMDLEKYRSKFNFLVNTIGKESKVIIEIGSHYGEDTIRFRHFFPNSMIYCFECDSRNIKVFEKYCNKLDNVKLIKKAVSNQEGILNFYLSYKNYTDSNNPKKYQYIDKYDFKDLNLNASGSSSLKKSNFEHLQDSIKTEVESVTLNSFCLQENIDQIDFLWIDVQGAEKDVLDGGDEILHKVKYIQLEYGELIYEDAMSKTDTIDYMKKKKFYILHDWTPSSKTGDLLFKNENL